ncbi:MAG: IMP cyclohydrolase [Chloroflexi bacterium]|jgi:IMP cyclohydrolase|nr:IMP cyclohydrolase [Chloroflexota bacterium]
MYIGRFVVVGQTPAGTPYLGYRVSSRSFPNRRIAVGDDRAVVLPSADAPPTDNPYVSYNCARILGDTAVVANGSHVDPIIDKVSIGYGLRDAIALSLLAMDYEHDVYNTPRIVAAIDGAGEGYIGIITEDKLLVTAAPVSAGRALLIATYEVTEPTAFELPGSCPDELVNALMDCEYELPVAGLVVMPVDDEYMLTARSVIA